MHVPVEVLDFGNVIFQLHRQADGDPFRKPGPCPGVQNLNVDGVVFGGRDFELRVQIFAHFDVLEHPAQLVYIIRRHADISQPFDHVFLFLTVDTENKTELKRSATLKIDLILLDHISHMIKQRHHKAKPVKTLQWEVPPYPPYSPDIISFD